MPTYRIDLGYDGSGFHGYARNHNVRTVQGELEAALHQVLGAPIRTTVAGRTDAGVHALGQVVSFEAAELDAPSVERSLRSMLAPEIVVTSLEPAPEGFSARFSARGRAYRYRVDDSTAPNPLFRTSVWQVGQPLDVTAMERAAASFLGNHDFASLCRKRPGGTTERTVTSATWTRRDDLVVFDVEARAFCHQMVRSMVALCVDAGLGRIDPATVPGILAAGDRALTRGVAPPHGLVLVRVDY